MLFLAYSETVRLISHQAVHAWDLSLGPRGQEWVLLEIVLFSRGRLYER